MADIHDSHHCRALLAYSLAVASHVRSFSHPLTITAKVRLESMGGFFYLSLNISSYSKAALPASSRSGDDAYSVSTVSPFSIFSPAVFSK